MEIQCNRSYFFFLSFFLPLLFKFDFDDIKTCLRMREFKKKKYTWTALYENDK